MATYVPAKINTAYIFYVGLTSQANGNILQVNPTLAAGDVKVATDDGAPGNLTTLPVVDADFTKRVKVSLSAGEMNGGNVTVIFSDAAGAEWCDLIVNIQTSATQIDGLATAINAEVVDALNVDTYAEPRDEAPVSTTTLSNKIGYLYKFMRNKIETTAAKINIYDDAGTNIDQTSTISDDGTTFTRGEFLIGE